MSKRNGRPPIDANDPSIRVWSSLPSKRYEALSHTAALARQSVPEFVRETLTRAVNATKLPARDPSV